MLARGNSSIRYGARPRTASTAGLLPLGARETGPPVPAAAPFCYPEVVKSSVSIVLFFLLSGFFLAILLGAIEHSRKLLGVAAGCLAAVVCIIVFLTPVELPSWYFGLGDDDDETETSSPLSISSTTSAREATSIAPRTTAGTRTTGSSPGATGSTQSITRTTEPPTATGSTSTTLRRTVTTGGIGG
jgi:hypothetical protein